jgi:hypothetical protein
MMHCGSWYGLENDVFAAIKHVMNQNQVSKLDVDEDFCFKIGFI